MSLWVCPDHGLYGGQVFCPQCGKNGEWWDGTFQEEKPVNPHIAACKLITLLDAHEDQGRQSKEGNDQAHLLFLLWSIHRGDVQDEKAHRWLGYAQGLIVMLGLGSLEAMKSLNFESQDLEADAIPPREDSHT